jgi:hypothetical protein
MISALLGEFWPYIAGAVTLLLGALGIYAKGRSDARHADTAAKAKAAAKSTKDMNHADTMRDSDDAARIERLRDFAKRNDRP